MHAWLFCLFILVAGPVSARQLTFDHLSVEAGLSQSAVYDMVLDREGFLWVGTQDGLNRYDGHGFEVFQHNGADSTSLSGDWIAALEVDANGVLWVGTQGAGLNRLEAETGTFRAIRGGEDHPLPHDIISDISVAADGRLWLATYGGLVVYSPSTDSITVYTPDPEVPGTLPAVRVLSVVAHPDGSIWAATDGAGLAILDPETGQFTPVDLGPTPADIVLSLDIDDDLSVWAGTAGAGAFHVAPDGTILGHVERPRDWPPQTGRINAVVRDDTGRLWAGTDGGGMLRVDDKAYRFTRRLEADGSSHGLPSSTVNRLYRDVNGLLWVGTTGGGLARTRVFDLIPSTASVMGVAGDGEHVWMGTDGGGLVFEDMMTGHRRAFAGGRDVPHDRVMGVDIDASGQVWVASGGGVARLGDRPRQWTTETGLSDNRAFVTAAGERDDQVWIGTWSGLNLLRPSDGHIEVTRASDDGLSNNRIIDVMVSSTGALWVGTLGGGLNRRDAGATGFERFTEDAGTLSNNIVASIAEGSDGTIWVGTADGLNRIDPEDGLAGTFGTDDGLPNSTVYAVQEGSDGRLWMSTNRGLASMDIGSGAIRTFDITDGLQNNEFNQGAVFETADGTLLFGGISGVTRFHPDAISRPVQMATVLTGVSTDRTVLPVTSLGSLDAIEIHPEDGNLGISFASTDLRNPRHIRFRWRLSDRAAAWSELPTDQRSIMLSALGAGRHTLEIESSIPGGPWSGSVRRLEVHVIPPFWRTIWFRAFVFLVVLAVLVTAGEGVHRHRVRVLQQREREQEEIHRRLMQSREAERLRLAQELHDGAMQDLYGVRYTLTDGHTGTSEDIQRVITKLRQICGELRPSVLAPFGLERAIRAYMDDVAERIPELHVRLHLDADGQRIPEEARLALFRMVQESVANVIKHARAHTVDVTLRLEGPGVTLCIEDDGRGFEVPGSWLDLGRMNHYGLLGLSERVRALGGALDVASRPGKGTRIFVSIPDLLEA